MSALGQKQTFAPQKVMSALPPKADVCSAIRHVCFGPIAGIAGLIDYLVGAAEQRRGYGEAEHPGGLRIDD